MGVNNWVLHFVWIERV